MRLTERVGRLVEELAAGGLVVYQFSVMYNNWYKHPKRGRWRRRSRGGKCHQTEVNFTMYTRGAEILAIDERHFIGDTIRVASYAQVEGQWFRQEKLFKREDSLKVPSPVEGALKLLGLPRLSSALSSPRGVSGYPPGSYLRTWAYSPEVPLKQLVARIRKEAPPPLHRMLIQHARDKRYASRAIPRGVWVFDVWEELNKRLFAVAPNARLDVRHAKVGHRPSVRAYNRIKKEGAKYTVDFEVDLPSGKYMVGFSYE